MASKPTFSQEISNLMYASHGNPTKTCIQCGTCAGTCPVVEFMDETPRRLIGMINANLKEQVLAAKIDIADVMYTLKRYSIWNKTYSEDWVGPTFSETFVKTIVRSGRSYEPILAPTYMFNMGAKDFVQEAFTATKMMLKGRIPVLPPRIKRLHNFREMIRRIIPIGDAS
jgi:ferredoxin